MNACPTCGDRLPVGAQFCIACGAAVSLGATGPTQRIAPPTAIGPTQRVASWATTSPAQLSMARLSPLDYFDQVRPHVLFLIFLAISLWFITWLDQQSLFCYFPYWICVAPLLVGSAYLTPLRRLVHPPFLIIVGLGTLLDFPEFYILFPYWYRVALVVLAGGIALLSLWKCGGPRLQRGMLILGIVWLLVLPSIPWTHTKALLLDAKRLSRGMTVTQVHAIMADHGFYYYDTQTLCAEGVYIHVPYDRVEGVWMDLN
jgi:hypothetical protein